MQETMSTLVLKKRHHINFFLSAKKKNKKNERRETEHTKDIFWPDEKWNSTYTKCKICTHVAVGKCFTLEYSLYLKHLDEDLDGQDSQL